MNIAIDVRTVQAHSRTGLWAYTQGMVEGLSRIDPQNDYFLLATGLRVRPADLPLDVGGNFRKTILPVPDRSFAGKRFFWNDVAVPLFCIQRGIRVFWQPAGHNLPRWGGFRKVITVHDLRSLYIKDFLSQDIEGLRRAMRSADRVIAISEFTKKDVIEHLGADEKKVVVVYNGVDRIERVENNEQISAFRERFGISDRPYIFSLGMVPRKNVKRTIEAFANSRLKGDFYLVFAGAHGGFLGQYRELAIELGVEKDVIFLETVSEEDLRFLYSGAMFFVFPSLFEGFGLPVLEAQMCGLAVICSNTAALPEIVGDSAILVDPYSVEDIAKAMERLAFDQQLRDSLSEKGILNARRFDWNRSAERLLELFNELA